MRSLGMLWMLCLLAWITAVACPAGARPTEPGPRRPAAAAPAGAAAPKAPPTTLGTGSSSESLAPTLPFMRGMALGLHSQDADFDYASMLREIRLLDAEWVALFFSLEQEKADSITFDFPIGEEAQMAVLQRAVRDAHAAGLKTIVFPIVLLANPGKGEWRGALAPADRAAWHRNYRAMFTRLARNAQQWGSEALSIGSEFCSLEIDDAEWRQTIAAGRQVYNGLLTYSANWDHYDHVKYWDQLDLIAITGYYELSKVTDPDLETLVTAWRGFRRSLLRWYQEQTYKKPIIFSEIGYPNQDGCSMYPWDYTRMTQPDPAEQALCYESFIRVWDKTPELGGVFFYNWWYDPWHYTKDSAGDPGYSPRGKPAEQHVRRWFGQINGKVQTAGSR